MASRRRKAAKQERDDAGRMYLAMKQERDEWQELALEQSETIENLTQDNLTQAELETELEWRCETCRSFNALTYDCSSEWAPLKCVMNNFDGWEARDVPDTEATSC